MRKIYTVAALWFCAFPSYAQSAPPPSYEKTATDSAAPAKSNLHETARITEIVAGRFMSGGKAPFSSSIGFNFSFAIPNEKRHRVTEIAIGYDVLLDPSSTWYSRMVSTPYGHRLNPKNGRALTAGVAVSGILVNRPGAALTLGPELMFRYFAIPSVSNSAYGSDIYFLSLIEPAAGIKARLFVRGHFTAKAEYIVGLVRKMKCESNPALAVQPRLPINVSGVKVAIGFRL
ncbi:MAG: hypothetical protein KF744_06965 [Taibaiella sp.]|nr:hypothetical protein [Taibaiella sp.]